MKKSKLLLLILCVVMCLTCVLSACETNTEHVHNYGEASYQWEKVGESWVCTAQRVCADDSTHVLYEVRTAKKVVTTAPTCEADGLATYTATFTCEDFSTQEKTDTLPALSHGYGAWTHVEGTETHQRVCANDPLHVETANCSYINGRCSACGAMEPAEPHVHSYAPVAEIPATCSVAGTKAHYTCTCGKLFVDEGGEKTEVDASALAIAIDANAHSFGAPVCQVATDGNYYSVEKCALCGHENSTFVAYGIKNAVACADGEVSAIYGTVVGFVDTTLAGSAYKYAIGMVISDGIETLTVQLTTSTQEATTLGNVTNSKGDHKIQFNVEGKVTDVNPGDVVSVTNLKKSGYKFTVQETTEGAILTGVTPATEIAQSATKTISSEAELSAFVAGLKDTTGNRDYSLIKLSATFADPIVMKYEYTYCQDAWFSKNTVLSADAKNYVMNSTVPTRVRIGTNVMSAEGKVAKDTTAMYVGDIYFVLIYSSYKNGYVSLSPLNYGDTLKQIEYVKEVPATCTTDGCKAYYTMDGKVYSTSGFETTLDKLVIPSEMGHAWGEEKLSVIDGRICSTATCSKCSVTLTRTVASNVSNALAIADGSKTGIYGTVIGFVDTTLYNSSYSYGVGVIITDGVETAVVQLVPETVAPNHAITVNNITNASANHSVQFVIDGVSKQIAVGDVIQVTETEKQGRQFNVLAISQGSFVASELVTPSDTFASTSIVEITSETELQAFVKQLHNGYASRDYALVKITATADDPLYMLYVNSYAQQMWYSSNEASTYTLVGEKAFAQLGEVAVALRMGSTNLTGGKATDDSAVYALTGEMYFVVNYANIELGYVALSPIGAGNTFESHVHAFTAHEAVAATCLSEGKLAYYECACGLFVEKDGIKTKVTEADLVVAIDPTAHTFDKQIAEAQYLASGATCTAKATYYYSCECGACGMETFESGELAPHVYNQEIATPTYLASGATCMVQATYYKSCTCGACGTETFSAGELAPHSYHFVAGTPATCTAEGSHDYYYCDVCSKMWLEIGGAEIQETDLVIAVIAHVYNQKVVDAQYLATAATCKDYAVYYKSCTCGACDKAVAPTWTDRDGGYADHVYGELIPEISATCTATGVKAHYQCEVCSKLFVEEDGQKVETLFSALTIEKIAHVYDQEVVAIKYLATESTCTEHATYYKSCTCGACDKATAGTFTDESSALKPHVYDQKVIDEKYYIAVATCCTHDLYYMSCTCGACGTETFEDVESAYGDHNYQLIAEVSATCTLDGVKEHYVCPSCSQMFLLVSEEYVPTTADDVIIPMIAHVYDKEIVAPQYLATEATCTARATYYKSCVCGACDKATAETFTDEHSAYKAHYFTQEVVDDKYLISPATCTEHAVYYKSCTCGAFDPLYTEATFVWEDGELLPHVYDQQVIDDKYMSDETSCTEHAKYYYCCTCGYCDKDVADVWTDESSPLDQHKYNKEVVHADYLLSEATCKDYAVYYKSCSCGACDKQVATTFEDVEAGYAEHVYGDLIPQQNSSCTVQGMAAHYKCSVCDKFFDESKALKTEDELKLDLLPHVYDQQVIGIKYLKTAGTCVDKVVYYKSCECGAFSTTESSTFEGEIDANNHVYGTLIAEVSSTCTKQGMAAHYECECGKFFDENKQEKTEAQLTLELAPHVYDQEVADAKYLKTAGTCVEKAVYYKSCECGAFSTTESGTFKGEIDANNHVYGTKIDEVSSTCTKQGMVAHYECECGKFFDENKQEKTEDELKLALAPHVYDQQVADAKYLKTAGTCVDKAVYYKSCKCGLASESETFEGEIDANNHVYGTKIDEVSSTCTKQGTAAYYKCSVCEKLFDESKAEKTADELKLDLADHTYGTLISQVDSTCTTQGTAAYYKCSVCEKLFDTNKVVKTADELKLDLLPHVYDKDVKDSKYVKTAGTCIAKAVYYKSCTCGACDKSETAGTFEGEFDAINHVKGDLIEEISATCCSEGVVAHYNCPCGKILTEDETEIEESDLILDIIDHTYNQQVVAPEYFKKAATCTVHDIYYLSCVCTACDKTKAGSFENTQSALNPDNHGYQGPTYDLITEASQINDGDRFIIVGQSGDKYYVFSSTGLTGAEISMVDGHPQLTGNEAIFEFNIHKNGANVWSFMQLKGAYANKFIASTTDSVGVGQVTTYDAHTGANATGWTISIADGMATMSAGGTNTNKYLGFNATGSAFGCDSSLTGNYGKVMLYRYNLNDLREVTMKDGSVGTYYQCPCGKKTFATDGREITVKSSYTKVNNVATLHAFDKFIITDWYYTDFRTIDPSGTACTFDNNLAVNNEIATSNTTGVGILTLRRGTAAGAWRFYLDNGKALYLNGKTTSWDIQLLWSSDIATLANWGSWIPSITDGNVKMQIMAFVAGAECDCIRIYKGLVESHKELYQYDSSHLLMYQLTYSFECVSEHSGTATVNVTRDQNGNQRTLVKCDTCGLYYDKDTGECFKNYTVQNLRYTTETVSLRAGDKILFGTTDGTHLAYAQWASSSSAASSGTSDAKTAGVDSVVPKTNSYIFTLEASTATGCEGLFFLKNNGGGYVSAGSSNVTYLGYGSMSKPGVNGSFQITVTDTNIGHICAVNATNTAKYITAVDSSNYLYIGKQSTEKNPIAIYVVTYVLTPAN